MFLRKRQFPKNLAHVNISRYTVSVLILKEINQYICAYLLFALVPNSRDNNIFSGDENSACVHLSMMPK